MTDNFGKEIKSIICITEMQVKNIIKIWCKMFTDEICFENLHKLLEYVTNFYNNLMEESLEKERIMERETKMSIDETTELNRLLQIKVPPPSRDDNMPMEIFQTKIEENLKELRICLRKRREEICDLLLEQASLCDELDEDPKALTDDPLPTLDEIADFRIYLEKLKEERLNRLSEVSALRREIKGYLNTLNIEIETDRDKHLINDRHIKLDTNTFNGLEYLKKFYGDEAKKLHEQIDSTRKKVELLWERLQVSPSTPSKFKQCTEYNRQTYDMFNSELHRCETLKSQKIKQIIEDVRTQIVKLWDQTLKSEVERGRFSPFYSDNYSDELLELHEMELKNLKQFHQKNIQIFKLFEERKTLWERMVALDEKAADTSRYYNRGGQLLKEEKERKTIETKLPKIEAQIRKLVQAYVQKERKLFFVHGENIIDLMVNDWDKKNENKEIRRKRRNIQNVTVLKSLPVENVSNPHLSKYSQSLLVKQKSTPSVKQYTTKYLEVPSRFLKPDINIPQTSKKKSPQTSPNSKRVIGTTIKRYTGRHNLSVKKRRQSQGKTNEIKPSTSKQAVGLVVTDNDYTDLSSDDDTYKKFQKCLKNNARSSINPPTKYPKK